MLDRISLDNFKAFRHQEISLHGLTLLTGLNSSGKSTVMQALALLRQSTDPGLTAATTGLVLNGALVNLGSGRDVLHEDWAALPGLSGEHRRITITARGWEEQWTAAYEAVSDVLELRPPVTPQRVVPEVRGEGLFDFTEGLFQYLCADRISPQTTYQRSHEVAIRQRFLGVHGEHTVNYLRHHQDDSCVLPPLRHPRVDSAALLRQVEAWLGELSPGVRLDAVGIDNTDLVQLRYGFGGRAGLSASHDRRPTNVGFGLTYTLPIIVACLTARPGSLILLENPEAHLHPKGQTQVAYLMARAVAAGAQLIVETHSDHVLNGLRLAVKDGIVTADDVQPHYFHRHPDDGIQITSPRIGTDGMLSEWPEGFFDEMDSALEHLLDE